MCSSTEEKVGDFAYDPWGAMEIEFYYIFSREGFWSSEYGGYGLVEDGVRFIDDVAEMGGVGGAGLEGGAFPNGVGYGECVGAGEADYG